VKICNRCGLVFPPIWPNEKLPPRDRHRLHPWLSLKPSYSPRSGPESKLIGLSNVSVSKGSDRSHSGFEIVTEKRKSCGKWDIIPGRLQNGFERVRIKVLERGTTPTKGVIKNREWKENSVAPGCQNMHKEFQMVARGSADRPGHVSKGSLLTQTQRIVVMS
jgi:hypothetical protein